EGDRTDGHTADSPFLREATALAMRRCLMKLAAGEGFVRRGRVTRWGDMTGVGWRGPGGGGGVPFEVGGHDGEDEFGAVVDAEFEVEPAGVGADGVAGEFELVGDAIAAVAVEGELNHLEFARREGEALMQVCPAGGGNDGVREGDAGWGGLPRFPGSARGAATMHRMPRAGAVLRRRG